MTLRTYACAAAMLGVMLSASGVARADPALPQTLDPAPITLRYGDLDLSTEAGAKELYGRITTAARKVCGPSFALWYPAKWQQWKACYEGTVDSTIKGINRPMLTALRERQLRVADR